MKIAHIILLLSAMGIAGSIACSNDKSERAEEISTTENGQTTDQDNSDDGWETEAFDDSVWPNATTCTNDEIGVINKASYTNFTEVFDDGAYDANFIWSTNVILDNLVLVRYTVDQYLYHQECIWGLNIAIFQVVKISSPDKTYHSFKGLGHLLIS